VNTSILLQELAPLNAQIEQVQGKVEGLKEKLRFVEDELKAFSTDNQRFDALRNVCDALDKLCELDAADLFWDEVPEGDDAAVHVERLRNRIYQFEAEIQSVQEKENSLKTQINQCLDELAELYREVHDAYAREERRKEAFIIEREISPIPYRATIMPWSTDSESESLFRRSLLIALLMSILLGYFVPLVNVPVPDPSAVVKVPERIAMLLKKEPPKPEPPPKQLREEKKPEDDQDIPTERLAKKQSKPGTTEALAARKKAESTGVLAFKSSFADLMDETPVARLGTEARLSKGSQGAPGQARGQRSLVAMQAKGSSGGIGNATVSRNVGNGGGGGGNSDGIGGGVGFARVASSLTGLSEQEGRAVSNGPGAGRTDEEIQIVFDRYKALLYRIYNKELRKNPTLRGKLLLRITIEPNGAVSKCTVESTDLASPELVALIVERVKKFNFSPKDGVPKTTILYPIDFLPAG
jgi:hypothetical protein